MQPLRAKTWSRHMPEEIMVKADALESLFEVWEEPNRHSVRVASGLNYDATVHKPGEARPEKSSR